MTVHWTEAALADLSAIESQLARRSVNFAQGFVDRVFSRVGDLAAQPLLGAEVPEYATPAVRELYEHPYRIVYRVADARLDVLAVVHAARRLPRGL